MTVTPQPQLCHLDGSSLALSEVCLGEYSLLKTEPFVQPLSTTKGGSLSVTLSLRQSESF